MILAVETSCDDTCAAVVADAVIRSIAISSLAAALERFGLRGDDVGQDAVVRRDDGGAGVVAARLDREDHGAGAVGVTGPAAGMSSSEPFSVAGVRHMMSASSPLSW